MREIIFTLLLFSGSQLFADCPNLSGNFTGDLVGAKIIIQQTTCISLNMSYSEDGTSTLVPHIFLSDKQVHLEKSGEYRKSFFANGKFITQLFIDSLGLNPAGPRQEYSIYSATGFTWLKASLFIDDNSQPEITLYKKQP